MIQPVIMKLVD